MKRKNISSNKGSQIKYKNFDTLPDVRIPKKIIPNVIDMYFQSYDLEVIVENGESK